jgi:hypothetical protein
MKKGRTEGRKKDGGRRTQGRKEGRTEMKEIK